MFDAIKKNKLQITEFRWITGDRNYTGETPETYVREEPPSKYMEKAQGILGLLCVAMDSIKGKSIKIKTENKIARDTSVSEWPGCRSGDLRSNYFDRYF